MKILIAEDNREGAKILQLTLQRFGHEVIVTRSGTEAWEIFNQSPTRLIVSDWVMPGLDGLDLCREVRARPHTPYTYFILLTVVDTSAENYELATQAGVDDFLSKPLRRATIQMRLRVAERILRFTREIGQLKALIPICSCCHSIHQDNDYWERVETYLSERTGARLIHGLCPDCFDNATAQVDPVTSPVVCAGA